ncbi:hypothetical protein ACFV6U_30065, partial [Streptomyces sp. NPDC059810]|uniref:hypothetical protein n=1 Tax=Streptomyces sp. NPDC059810 TaxID=3346956 RepID=UPI0036508CC8
YQDVADRVAAELLGLVGAGAGDQVGDDGVATGVVRGGRGVVGGGGGGARAPPFSRTDATHVRTRR